MTSAPSSDSAIVEPIYLSRPHGSLLLTCFRPRTPAAPEKTVLCLPPFAEEMNKSRRMMALQARLLAAAGYTFVLPDLLGTGDSEGRFEDSSWRVWLDDIGFVCQWLRERGNGSVDVIALRSGVFLCEGVTIAVRKIALWAPVLSGRKMVDDLLRTKVFRDRASGRMTRIEEIREELQSTGQVEIAGYVLTDGMVSVLDSLELATAAFPACSDLYWIDVTRSPPTQVPPRVLKVQAGWAGLDRNVSYSTTLGPQFWLGPEIELAPELLEETTRYIAAAA